MNQNPLSALFRRPVIWVFFFVLMVGLARCTKKTASSVSGQTTESKIVNVAIWSNYASPELLKEFENRTGIKVQISNYSSNEELLAKLQAGASGYDVAVPSDYMVSAMSHLGLLNELDYTQLTNSKLLEPKLLKKPFDPENKLSVPYDWGTTGIAVNRELYKGKITGWKSVFNATDLAGKLTLLDDVRETIGAALKSEGLSLNSKNPDDLKRAKEVLMRVRKGVKGFTSEPMVPLSNGETAVAHAFMSDAFQARRAAGGKIEYILPEEGGTLYIDNLVIPKGAQHLKEAHAFINFLLEPKSNVSTVLNVFVAPGNKEAFALLPKEVQDNKALFPTEAQLSKFEMMQDLGESLAQWDRVWTEIKASRD